MNKATLKSSPNHDSPSDYTPTRGPTKIEECLILLLTRQETHTHHASRAYGDSCLHTEVSSIQKTHGIIIDRVYKKVPNARSRNNYAHYFLVGENRIKAKILVDKLRTKRNAKPFEWEDIA